MLVVLLALGCKGDGRPIGDPPLTAADCFTDLDQFERDVSPVLQADCIVCHVAGGLAEGTRHVLVPDTDPRHLDVNFAVLSPLAAEAIDGVPLLLGKPSGALSHLGGVRFVSTSPEYATFSEFVARAAAPGGCQAPADLPPTCTPGSPVAGAAPLRRLSDPQFANAVLALTGLSPAEGLFPLSLAGDLYATWPEANVVSSAGAEGILLAAEDVSSRLVADLPGLVGCAETDAACLTAWTDQLAYRAFRRPLTGEEQALIDAIRASDPAPQESFRRVVELILQSPQFLYLDATSTPVPGVDGVEQLDGYTVAARLSFFLLGTTPSDELLDLAASGGLDTRAQVRALAAELVLDPRALPVVSGFHDEWLHLYQLDTIAKNPEAYPTFGPELVAEMRLELELFTTEVVWMGDGTFDALLYAQESWTSPLLDDLYGTADQRTGTGWEKRSLGAQRPGVLSRAAFLTAHAYSETSSPVRRGAFVIEQLLCEDLVPPPGIDLVLPEPTETNTIRERLAAHRADPTCAACHDRIDPIGFSFENYGALGEWRDLWENGIPVDATGSLEDPTGSFDGVPELLPVLDQAAHVRDCYARQWLSYGLGRGLDTDDQCVVDTVEERFSYSGGDLRDLLVEVAASDANRFRPTPVLEDP